METILNCIFEKDIPQQFHDKPMIEELIRSYTIQLEQLKQVFYDLDNKTDIDTAEGTVLDDVGSILVLSRKEAQIILKKAENSTITDSLYRKVLKYKSIMNNCDCTYSEMMRAISEVWNTENISYIEPPERPATVLLALPTVSLDAVDPSVGRVLTIRPAGVSVIYTIGYYEKFYLFNYEKFKLYRMFLYWKIAFYAFSFGKYKRLDGTWHLDGSVLLNAGIIHVPTLIRYSGILALFKEHIDARCTAKMNSITKSTAECNRFIMNSPIYEMKKDIARLDGSWELDGKHLLDSIVWSVPLLNIYQFEKILIEESISTYIKNVYETRMRNKISFKANIAASVTNKGYIREKIKVKTKVEQTQVVRFFLVSKRNIWYLDGTFNLDGSRYLNAIENKEEI